METKTCSLSEYEIKCMIANHCMSVAASIGQQIDDWEDGIERINYLYKRLKAKPKEEAPKVDAQPITEQKAATSW